MNKATTKKLLKIRSKIEDLQIAFIPILSNFLVNMVTNSEKYREFDSPNGWGLFDDFVPWLIEYLEACKKYPNAKIEAYV